MGLGGVCVWWGGVRRESNTGAAEVYETTLVLSLLEPSPRPENNQAAPPLNSPIPGQNQNHTASPRFPPKANPEPEKQAARFPHSAG